MAKLSDTQLIILSAACQRDDRLVLPLPDRLKGGAAVKVVGSLIAKGLVEEVPAMLDQPVWRESDDDRRITLVATDAAFAALGIEPEDAPQDADEAPSAEAATTDATPADDAHVAPAAPPARKTREGSKQARLVEMLKAPEGDRSPHRMMLPRQLFGGLGDGNAGPPWRFIPSRSPWRRVLGTGSWPGSQGPVTGGSTAPTGWPRKAWGSTS
jgi:hypothetical protein